MCNFLMAAPELTHCRKFVQGRVCILAKESEGVYSPTKWIEIH